MIIPIPLSPYPILSQSFLQKMKLPAPEPNILRKSGDGAMKHNETECKKTAVSIRNGTLGINGSIKIFSPSIKVIFLPLICCI